MKQVLIDRATLEQLVVALNNAEDALNNSQALIAGRERFGFAKTCYATNEITLGFVSPAITAGRKALANAEPAGWQKIETAPEGTMILCANMKAMEARSWAYVAWIAGGKVCGHRMDMPTHWMPLPTPPKEQQ